MRYLITGGSGFIGTNLTEALVSRGAEVRNVDILPPKIAARRGLWRAVDIADSHALQLVVDEFQPTVVVHCAARTDTDSDVLDDYRVNFAAARNVFTSAAEVNARTVHLSTQFVVRPGVVPQPDDLYDPHTTYGLSKALAEEILRTEFLDENWVILRPTNVWGLWHPRYPREFWRVLRAGRYFHPGSSNPTRAYAWVGTVAEQIYEASIRDVRGRTLYAGDAPVQLLEWVDAFALALTGRPTRHAPRSMLRAVALAGDALGRAGISAPLTSSRLRSMTEDYVVPMDPTFAALGEPSRSWSDGVEITAAWLRSQQSVP